MVSLQADAIPAEGLGGDNSSKPLRPQRGQVGYICFHCSKNDHLLGGNMNCIGIEKCEVLHSQGSSSKSQ